MNYQKDPRYLDLLNYLKTNGFNGHPRFYELLATAACLHNDKNHDYSEDSDPLSNLRECEELGIHPLDGVAVRISDKDARFKKWYKNFRNPKLIINTTKDTDSSQLLKVKDESVTRTLLDRSVYTLLQIILLEENIGTTEEF